MLLFGIILQISYNFMLPFENIPDDLVPLTAHFKHLLTYASTMQPLFFFLDSIDQLTGTADKVSWLPTRMPPNCKVIYKYMFIYFYIFLQDLFSINLDNTILC